VAVDKDEKKFGIGMGVTIIKFMRQIKGTEKID
jgi:hypothetical protein